ncbi:MAG: 50S ribosomal protein L3 [Firmicutes bacterium]|nr:50S ribosomal protein L3 [Bacillota bacterium]
MKGILGRKIGMTQVFNKEGKLIPVTVVYVGTNVVTQIKTKENDGYEAIQLAFGEKREKLSNKAELGHLKKANTTPKRFLKEIRGVDVNNFELGQEIHADFFEAGEVVDVQGTSKGKGFQGVIKRHNQSRGPMGHGSHYHRGPGSMGTMRPMRVFKGKKLPGHMGMETVTIQNLEVVAVDMENGCLLIKGNVPGAKKSFVVIKSSVKNPGKINEVNELVSYEPEVVETVEETVVAEQTTEEVNESSQEETAE